MATERSFWEAAVWLPGVLCVVAAAGCGVLRAPTAPAAVRADTTLTAAAPLARFEGARGLGVAPDGTVYVADAARDVIVRLPTAGDREAVLGGSGGQAGQFDRPADVDPTNGLVIVVADAGNGRIQRFSDEFRHLGTLPVGRGYAAAGQTPARPVFDAQTDGSNDLGGGRPVAVRDPDGDATYALDAAEGHVLKWEDQRQTVRIIGGFSDGAGALRDPVGLAVGPDGTLYVADPGRGAVMTYDRFGSFLAARARGRADSARAVAVGPRGRLYLAKPRSVLILGGEGRLLRRVTLRLGASDDEGGGVVDVAPHERGVFVLTPGALYRFERL
jgi:sugar lactone lactonase YvrE